MIELINQLGGKKDFLILLMIITILYLLNSLVNNKNIRIIFSIFSSIYLLAQSLSLYFTQSFIGYQFYVHANLRGVVGIGSLFFVQIIIASFYFAILVFINIKSHALNQILLNETIKNKFIKIASVLFVGLLLFIIAIQGNFTSDTKTLFPLLKSNGLTDFNATLKKHKMDGYVTPDHVECSKGHNIIVISMESLEKAYLNGEYSSLTPNLNKLKSNWNYFDLHQNEGSSWTSGSLYTYLTGFPAFFGVHGNSIFQTAYHSNITSITHALKKANYTISYLNGNTDYSGVKEMLHIFQFDNIIDYKSANNTGYESDYGIRDKDLFSLAKNEVTTLNKTKEPFALFISTTDTHFPNGIYDERMESVISPKNTDLEFTVASLDYLIGDFISFLEKQDILKNTTIYIFPDHLKMGDPSIFMNLGERSLYCITNSKFFVKETSLPLYQIDLPKIILAGANINHNLKFLTDYIIGNKSKYIQENILPLTEINTNGILNSEVEVLNLDNVSKDYANYKSDTLRYIAHAGGQIDGKTYTNSLEALNLSYSKGFRLFELDIIKTKDNHFVAAHDWEHWAKIVGYEGELPVSNQIFLSKKIFDKYTPLDMKSINRWFNEHQDAILVTDKVNTPIEFSNLFIDKQRLMMELFDDNAVKEGLSCKILSAMPSQSVVDKLSKSDIKELADEGVQNIAVSRYFIKDNKRLLEEFKNNGIRPFVYNINFDTGIDEDYVVKYEMDYIFGIYADVWSFE